jgi:hypothetical protein
MNQQGWLVNSVVDTILWILFFLVAVAGIYFLMQQLF